MELRQGTAVKVPIGEFVDVTDGKTPETGIALGTADEAELLKHGSTSVVDISGRTWGAIASCDGHYSLSLTTADTDTQGNLRVIVQDDSECLPVRNDFSVVSQQYWDSKYSTDYLHVNTVELSSGAQSAVDLKDFADAGYNPATNYITGVAGTKNTFDDLNDISSTEFTGLRSATTAIWAETSGIGAKLPNSYIMGSSSSGSRAGTIDAIQTGMTALQTATTAIWAETSGLATDVTNLIAASTAIWAETSGLATDMTNLIAATTAIWAETTGLNADVANLISATTAIWAETTGLQGKLPASFIMGSSDNANWSDDITTLQTGITALLTSTTALEAETTAITAAIAALNDLSAADVNAQVLDVLNTDTFAEPAQGAPAATATLVYKIGLLYKFARNKIISNSTVIEIYNDAGAVVDQKAAITSSTSDFTRGEFGTGP